jgi:hypothetical protein
MFTKRTVPYEETERILLFLKLLKLEYRTIRISNYTSAFLNFLKTSGFQYRIRKKSNQIEIAGNTIGIVELEYTEESLKKRIKFHESLIPDFLE